MSGIVFDRVVSDLKTMYSDQPTYNAVKIEVIVENVIDEVIRARRYREEDYSDEQIELDLMNYRPQIYSLAEYDLSKFGAPHETSHSENSTSRTWIERNKLFAGIIPLSHF